MSCATVHHPAHTCTEAEELADMLHAEQEAHAATRAALAELAQLGEEQREALRRALARLLRRASSAADEYRDQESVPSAVLTAVLLELETLARLALKGGTR